MLKFKLRLAPLLKVVFMYSIRGSSLDPEKAIIYLDVQFGMYTVILPSIVLYNIANRQTCINLSVLVCGTGILSIIYGKLTIVPDHSCTITELRSTPRTLLL